MGVGPEKKSVYVKPFIRKSSGVGNRSRLLGARGEMPQQGGKDRTPLLAFESSSMTIFRLEEEKKGGVTEERSMANTERTKNLKGEGRHVGGGCRSSLSSG